MNEVLQLLRDKGDISQERYLELKQRAAAEKKALPKVAPEPVSVADRDFRVHWKDGLHFESGDKAFKLKIGGRIQSDFAAVALDRPVADFLGVDSTQSGVEIRRTRLYLSGQLYKHFKFKMQYDFAGGEVEIKDLYLAAKDLPYLQTVILGHQKQPFSLEQMTSSNDLTFMERSVATSLDEGRNIGVAVHQLYLDERVGFGIGAFRVADNFGDGFGSGDDYNLSARLTGLPVYQDGGETLVHLGVGYGHGFIDREVRFKQRPESHLAPALLDTGGFSAGAADLVRPEIAVVIGPFSAQAEYVRGWFQSPTTNDPSLWGAYGEVSYFLTGEHRPYKKSAGKFVRVKPKRNFLGDEGGWGAWQVAARVSHLDFNDAGLHGGTMTNSTAGLNWYLNPNMRLMFNYVYSHLNGVGDTNVFQTRFQIAL